MSASERAWALWGDWCEATSHDPGQVTAAALDLFGTHVPGTAPALVPVAAVKRHLLVPPPRDPWALVEPQWAPLKTALARCPTYGWPQAVPGRRDAWLLIATRILRLNRRRTVALRARDLPALLERLPSEAAPRVCARCVTRRWLDVVDTHAKWSRSSVRTKVWARPAGTWSPSTIGAALPCDGKCSTLPALLESLPGHTVIAPAVDRHGWWADWRPLTPRALTRILACRGDRYGEPPAPDEPPVSSLEPVAEFDETTLERLDAAMDAADALNFRLEALLAEPARQAGGPAAT